MGRAASAFLSTENLRHNLKIIRQKAAGSRIIAMVKANAYGHGLRSTALRLAGCADCLGVASIDEALILRKVGVKTPIVLMEGVFSPEELAVAAQYHFAVVFHQEHQIAWLERSAPTVPLTAWLKINTGMNRLGICPSQSFSLYSRLAALPTVAGPVGLMSHLAVAEDQDHFSNGHQRERFQQAVGPIVASYGDVPQSFCNSAGIFHFPHLHHHYIRPGLAMYGVSPMENTHAAELGLKPVMTLQTALISRGTLAKGAYVGYGCRFRSPAELPIGVIAFGYGDGYPVSAQDGTPVVVRGTRCTLIGRVSMDMMTVNLEQCPEAVVGDTVTLWGEGLPLEEVVRHMPYASTFSALTGIQHRVNFYWTPLVLPC